jgi:AraC-like DNA-binding protein
MTEFSPFHFSTATLAERDRIPFWREAVWRPLVHVDVNPLPDAPFEAEVTLRDLPGLRTLSCVSSAAHTKRTPEHLADGDNAVTMVINRSGTMVRSQRDRDVSLKPGDATFILHAEPATLTHSQIHYESVAIPHAELTPFVGDVEGAATRIVPHGNEAVRLLASYLEFVREHLVLATPDFRQLAITHVRDLFAMVLGASGDGAAIAAERGVRAARLAAIKADIAARLDRRDFGLAAVAARQHVTPRYVQMLFENEGVTFSQFVLAQRLARAHRMLISPQHAAWSISAVAMAAGFGDLSYFNRKFRQRYGATPSDVRSAARG